MPVMMSLLLTAAMAAQGAPGGAGTGAAGYVIPNIGESPSSFTQSAGAPGLAQFPSAEQRLTNGASLAAVTGGSGLASAVRASDWRTNSLDSASGARLSVSIYDPADPSLPLNGLSAGAPLTAAELGAAPGTRTPSFAINYERDLIQGSSGDYDFTISQRAAFSRGPQGAVAGAGTIARIGQNLDRARESKPSWYFFAGADAEALTIDPRQGFSDMEDSMRLQDYTLVGDAQAGVAFAWGPADIALAYVQKEREYSTPSYGITRKDDFAALSFTLRR